LEEKMKLLRMKLFTVITGFALAISLASVHAEEMLIGKVVDIHDGDTITLLTEDQRIHVRMAQIDAPELDQSFGPQSQQALHQRLFHKNVRVSKTTVDRHGSTVDKYGRTVGTVFIDNVNVNKEQVKKGMAWAYRQYVTDPSLLIDEENARHSQLGLWSEPDPVKPWNHRHTRNLKVRYYEAY
jgi:endonuclease YncB( thermonuclease family)